MDALLDASLAGGGWISEGRRPGGSHYSQPGGRRYNRKLTLQIDRGDRRSGELAGARTQDPRLKRALLYLLSYELVQGRSIQIITGRELLQGGAIWLERLTLQESCHLFDLGCF